MSIAVGQAGAVLRTLWRTMPPWLLLVLFLLVLLAFVAVPFEAKPFGSVFGAATW